MISLACSPPWLSFLLAFHDVLIVSLLNSDQRRLFFFYRNLIEMYATGPLQEFSNYYQKKNEVSFLDVYQLKLVALLCIHARWVSLKGE